MMDHRNTPNQQPDAAAPDMQYLTKPRGRGYSLRMVTPEVLIGTTNPFTKKPFGKEIKLGLNTQVHAEAVRLRDVRIGAIRQLEAEALAEAGKRHIGRIIELTPEAAEGWRKERARDTSEEGRVDLILSAEIDKAVESGKEEEAYRFADMVYRGAMPLEDMLEQYLQERSPNNPFGYDPLSRTTALDVRSSIKHFKTFLGVEHPTLRDATPDKVFKFRTEYLPLVAKVSPGTINKHTTLLRGLWKWAIVDKKYVKDKRGRSVTNPWEIRERGTSKRKATHKSPEESRTAFTAKQVNTLLSGFSQWGTMACCRFRGHRDKVFMKLEELHDEKSFQPRV